eukprot:830905-Pyramimonas_sp.AAC.1
MHRASRWGSHHVFVSSPSRPRTTNPARDDHPKTQASEHQHRNNHPIRVPYDAPAPQHPDTLSSEHCSTPTP